MHANQNKKATLILTVIFICCGVFDFGHSFSYLSKSELQQKELRASIKKNSAPDEDDYHRTRSEISFNGSSQKQFSGILFNDAFSLCSAQQSIADNKQRQFRFIHFSAPPFLLNRQLQI